MRVEADDKHAAAVALVDSAFEVDIKAASLLAGVQKGLLAGEVPVQPATPHARSVILEQEALAKEAFQLSEEAKEGGQPEKAREDVLVRGSLNVPTCSEDVAVRRAQFSADCAAAHNQRQNELLVLRTVKAAIELGMVERAAFAKKSNPSTRSSKKKSEHQLRHPCPRRMPQDAGSRGPGATTRARSSGR